MKRKKEMANRRWEDQWFWKCGRRKWLCQELPQKHVREFPLQNWGFLQIIFLPFPEGPVDIESTYCWPFHLFSSQHLFLCSLWWTLCQFSFNLLKFLDPIHQYHTPEHPTLQYNVDLLRIIFADYIVKSCKCCRKMGLYFWCKTRIVLQDCKSILQNSKYSLNNIPS
jgi:hypothetical protein